MHIDATDYEHITKVSSPSLAPDGETVAFLATTPRSDDAYTSRVCLVATDGGPVRTFTMSDAGAGAPHWSPDGSRIAFVSSRGDRERPQLWVAPVDGGEAQRVTAVPGGVGSVTWSPDGGALAFIQEVTDRERQNDDDLEVSPSYEGPDPDPRTTRQLKYRLEPGARPARTWEPYFDGARSQVYIVDLPEHDGGPTADGTTGTVTRVTDADRDHFAPAWGDERTLYLLGRVGADDASLHDIEAYDRDSETLTTVQQTSIEANTVPDLAATSDGRLAYPWDDPSVDLMPQTELQVYDRETDQTTTPTTSLDRKPSHSHGVSWGPTNDHLFFTTDDAGGMTVRRVVADGSAAPEAVVEGTAINGVAIGDERVVVTQSEWDHPGDVFTTGHGETGVTRLTQVNDTYLADRDIQQPEEFWYDSEGHSIQGWVLTPPEFDPTETYPLVAEVHGGPSPVMWTPSGTMWHEFQTLAAEGYVVFWSNPRGSTGYGGEFMRAVARDWGGPFYRDVIAGVEAVCERDYVDEDQLYITGGSYGGYMVGWTVGQTDRFAAGVAQRGVYDLTTMYGTTTFPELLEWYYDTLPWEEPELLWDHSPVAHAAEVDTPTLILQSENDFNTPAADSEMFYRYLNKNDVDTEYVVYPREGHELSRAGEPAHVVDRLERIIDWFDQYPE